MSRQKSRDRLFMIILYILVHIGLIYVFCRAFMSFIWQYQTYDDSIRALLYDQKLECTNISLVIDHILTQKHDTATQLLMHLTYITGIFVAMVVMLSRNFPLIVGYTLFFMGLLGGNLVVPIITPFTSLTVFVISTILGITYICVHLCGPKHSNAQKKRRGTTGLNPPEAPPFPDDIDI